MLKNSFYSVLFVLQTTGSYVYSNGNIQFIKLVIISNRFIVREKKVSHCLHEHEITQLMLFHQTNLLYLVYVQTEALLYDQLLHSLLLDKWSPSHDHRQLCRNCHLLHLDVLYIHLDDK